MTALPSEKSLLTLLLILSKAEKPRLSTWLQLVE